MILLYIVGIIAVILGISAFFGAPYVPSRRRDVAALIATLWERSVLTEQSVVLDIGSGDGVVLRALSARGVRSVGYEIHPVFALVSKWLCRRAKRGGGAAAPIVIRWANAWTKPFPDNITHVYAFSVSRDGKRLAATVQREASRLGRPLEVFCYGSPLPNNNAVEEIGAYYRYRFEPLG